MNSRRFAAGCLVGILGGLLPLADAGAVRADSPPVVHLDGRAASPALAHDFNGDGYADLAIGAALRTVGGRRSAGALWVIKGSARGLSASGSQYLTMDSAGIKGRARTDSYFGQSVTSADWDADGYADLAVRAREDVLVIIGSPQGLSTRDQWVNLERLGSGYFGLNGPSTATGDFDADGYPDLVLGNSGGEEEIGEIMVLRGSPSGHLTRHARYIGRATPEVAGGQFPDDFFGDRLAAGDVTGDGYDDLLVTSARRANGGSLYLFRGSAMGLRVGGNTFLRSEDIRGGQESLYLGSDSALAVADFDSDGYADAAVGSVASCRRSSDWCGAVVLLRGSASGLDRRSPQWWDQDSAGIPDVGESDDAFGSDLAVGDLDGDGHLDLAATVPSEDVDGIRDAGAVAVLYGTARGLSARRSELWSQATPGVKGRARPEEGFGFGPVRVLNVDGDRSQDLAIHTPMDVIGKRSGSVNVLHGSSDGVTTRDHLWQANSRGLAGRTRAEGTGFGDR